MANAKSNSGALCAASYPLGISSEELEESSFALVPLGEFRGDLFRALYSGPLADLLASQHNEARLGEAEAVIPPILARSLRSLPSGEPSRLVSFATFLGSGLGSVATIMRSAPGKLASSAVIDLAARELISYEEDDDPRGSSTSSTSETDRIRSGLAALFTSPTDAERAVLRLSEPIKLTTSEWDSKYVETVLLNARLGPTRYAPLGEKIKLIQPMLDHLCSRYFASDAGDANDLAMVVALMMYLDVTDYSRYEVNWARAGRSTPDFMAASEAAGAVARLSVFWLHIGLAPQMVDIAILDAFLDGAETFLKKFLPGNDRLFSKIDNVRTETNEVLGKYQLRYVKDATQSIVDAKAASLGVANVLPDGMAQYLFGAETDMFAQSAVSASTTLAVGAGLAASLNRPIARVSYRGPGIAKLTAYVKAILDEARPLLASLRTKLHGHDELVARHGLNMVTDFGKPRTQKSGIDELLAPSISRADPYDMTVPAYTLEPPVTRGAAPVAHHILERHVNTFVNATALVSIAQEEHPYRMFWPKDITPPSFAPEQLIPIPMPAVYTAEYASSFVGLDALTVLNMIPISEVPGGAAFPPLPAIFLSLAAPYLPIAGQAVSPIQVEGMRSVADALAGTFITMVKASEGEADGSYNGWVPVVPHLEFIYGAPTKGFLDKNIKAAMAGSSWTRNLTVTDEEVPEVMLILVTQVPTLGPTCPKYTSVAGPGLGSVFNGVMTSRVVSEIPEYTSAMGYSTFLAPLPHVLFRTSRRDVMSPVEHMHLLATPSSMIVMPHVAQMPVCLGSLAVDDGVLVESVQGELTPLSDRPTSPEGVLKITEGDRDDTSELKAKEQIIDQVREAVGELIVGDLTGPRSPSDDVDPDSEVPVNRKAPPTEDNPEGPDQRPV